MNTGNRLTILHTLGRERFLFLLLFLLLYLGLAPFLKDWITARLLLTILLSAVFLSTIYAVSQTRRQAVLVSILAVPMLATTWLTYVMKWRELTLASNLFSILFMLSPEQKQSWVQKLEGHMKRSGIEPDRW